jgi:hypothetical protein
MSACPQILAISSSVSKLPVAYPRHLEVVFDRLEEIREEVAAFNKRPSDQTIDWARQVLLGVVPSTYLRTAEINPFEQEIHVTWESEAPGKSVIVFFPGPGELKIYHERIDNGVVVDHGVVDAQTADVSDRLRWFFE